VPLLVGLFGVAVALGPLGRVWAGPSTLLSHLDVWGTAVVAAASSVLVNNLPAASLLAARTPDRPFALLIGLNLGPNLLVTGSLAWMLWLRAARSAGAQPSIAKASRIGVLAVLCRWRLRLVHLWPPEAGSRSALAHRYLPSGCPLPASVARQWRQDHSRSVHPRGVVRLPYEDEETDMTEVPGQAQYNVTEWSGKMLIDIDGEKIGKLQDVYVDVETDVPQFATVKEGVIGRHLTFVPLVGIQVGPDDLQVSVTKEQVRSAPDIEMHGEELTQADESTLYHHFELNYTPINTESGRRLARR
jgi:hypothetical protein